MEAYSEYAGEKLIIIKEINDDYHRVNAYFHGDCRLDLLVEPEISDDKLKSMVKSITKWNFKL